MDLLSPSELLSSFSPTFISTVFATLTLYLRNWYYLDQVSDQVATYLDYSGEEFDFIIVGAGSAGGVLANRLSKYYNVLLLEAGGEMHPWQLVPAMSLLMLNHDEIDWKHRTVSQQHACFSLPNNESHWSQGKGVGGTSNLHFLIQSRGNPRDFDNWAQLLGDPSWSYQGMLPYFKKSEQYAGRWAKNGLHGTKGPTTISEPDYLGMAEMYIDAARDLGYHRADLNGYYTEGFDTILYPIKKGLRNSVYGAYIHPTRLRFTLRKFAHVNKVLVDANKRAYGVEYEKNDKIEVAYAKYEVIISAGTVNSPKILMHSGIGHGKELRKLGIPLKHHLPGVGKNLQDHLSVYVGPFFIDEPISFSIERDINSITAAQFVSTGTGVCTSSGTQAMGFITSSKARQVGEYDWPDIQMILVGVSVGPNFAQTMSRAFGPYEDILEKYYDHAVGKDSFHQIVSVGRPHARGYIELDSTDPKDPVLIQPNYLDNKHDLQVLIEGVKKSIELVEKTQTFALINGRFTNESFPGCEHTVFRSDEYWECYIRSYSITLHHIVGTCSMGKRYSRMSVVDPQMKVVGITGLRVIDASVIPVVTVGNTNAPVVAIAEKGADLILKEWELAEKQDSSTKQPETSIGQVLTFANEAVKTMTNTTDSMCNWNILDTSSEHTGSIASCVQNSVGWAQDIIGNLFGLGSRLKK